MPNPYWADKLTSYWAVRIPTAVNGTIPNWGVVGPKALAAFQIGCPVISINGNGKQYVMDDFDSTNLKFSRKVVNYSSSVKVRFYWMTINRSTGATASNNVDVTS